MAGTTIFINASDARQNPIREHIVHDEGTAIERAILDAVQIGLYSVVVSDGTPMTQSTVVASSVVSIDPDDSSFLVPNHGFSTGDTVQLNSTGTLPSPLNSTSKYYVIYEDANNIKLSTTKQNAISGRPIPITITQGVNGVQLTNQGSGYLVAPMVSFTGGNCSVPATAVASLANYGSVSSISVSSNGNGYTDIPTVDIVAQGLGATAGTVYMGVVAATPALGGLSYRLNDTLTVLGGTGTAAVLTITEVDNTGAVLAVTVNSAGSYSALPSLINASTIAVPSGGNGCTLNLNIGIVSIAIATGGVGYVRQPFVSITSNSGTGASATAFVVAGAISQINMVNSGSGYTSAPTVSFISGENASAIAILQPTEISNVIVSFNGGNVYTDIPSVSLVCAGSGAEAGQVSMNVSAITLNASGINYAVGDILLIAGGAGSMNATIQVMGVGSLGQITGYVLMTSGIFTSLPPLVNNSVLGGAGVSATFNLTMSLYSVGLAQAGSGYTTPPTIVVTDSTGYGASVISTIRNGQITGLTVTAPGTLYTDIPSITITNGEGVIVSSVLNPSGVASFNVGNVGSGYTHATVQITGSGIGAAAHATINNGQVIALVLDQAGSGYVSAPNVVIQGDGSNATATALLEPTSLNYIELVNGGDGYTSIPNVVISGSALATATLASTGINRIDVVNGGDTYTSVPIVTIIPAADQVCPIVSPVLSTTIGYSIGAITVTNSGVGYQTAPTVNINVPQTLNGNLATAIATIGIGQGSLSISLYPASLDYFGVWKNQVVSDQSVIRPYSDRMSTIINYFTNLGYSITQQTNPNTGNTMQWLLSW